MARRRGRRASQRTVKIGSKGFEEAIAQYVEEVCLDVEDQCVENAEKAGEQCVALLKANSRRSNARGKHYADGWEADMRISQYGITVTVHNRAKPGLTHLLEKGHDVIVNGQRRGRAACDGVIKQSADAVGGILYEGYD